MSTYYISPAGNDANAGTSQAYPWKTIAKVDATNFKPGDSILFQGGQTFSGSLLFTSADGNSTSSVVKIASYGNGQATISAGRSDGIYLRDTGGFDIENLNIVGTPGSSPQSGVHLEAWSHGQSRSDVKINGCNISGFYEAGILIEGDYSDASFNNVTITNNSIDNNVENGIFTCASYDELGGLYIGYNQVYNNYGDGVNGCTGSGITLGDTNGAVVEYNNAYLNGSRGGKGGVGIWAYESNDVTFQYNASYDNKSPRGGDGDGFDFDSDVTNSVMQYNYAADNDGTGIQLDQWRTDGGFKNNTVRYNVLDDNGRTDNYGNLEAWGEVDNCYFYNNTIYTTPGVSGSNSAIRVHNSTIPGLYVNGVHFVDNIIVTAGGTNLINVPSQESSGAKNLTFTGNVYYSSGSTFDLSYGGTTYHTLAAFQAATGQEMYSGKSAGLSANPDLLNPSTTTLFTESQLKSMTAFKLASNSPALSVTYSAASMFGLSTGSTDFYGNSITNLASPVAGADQSLKTTGKLTTGTTTTTTTTTTTSTGSSTTTSGTTTSNSSTGSTSALAPATALKGTSIASSGSTSNTGNNYTVTGSGADIWNNSDAFEFVNQTLTGNGTIVAEVGSMTDADTWSKAGVMIRNGTTANAAEVSSFVTPGGIDQNQTRATAGAATSAVDLATKGDHWLEIVRSGNTFTTYASANGTAWTLIANETVAMNSTVYVGLAVTSHNASKTETAKFSNVEIT